MVAAAVVAGLAIFDPPVSAQLPELPPITLTPSDPATTTTTLLPPLLPSDELLPAPPPDAPPPTLLPVPSTAPARRTTTFKPPPVPPSTPARSTKVVAKTKAPPASTATPADQVEGAELGEADPGFGAALPFEQEAAAVPVGDDTMELGIEASARREVGTMASVAAGLIAIVLLGVALWLRSEIRGPAPLPPW